VGERRCCVVARGPARPSCWPTDLSSRSTASQPPRGHGRWCGADLHRCPQLAVICARLGDRHWRCLLGCHTFGCMKRRRLSGIHNLVVWCRCSLRCPSRPTASPAQEHWRRVDFVRYEGPWQPALEARGRPWTAAAPQLLASVQELAATAPCDHLHVATQAAVLAASQKAARTPAELLWGRHWRLVAR